VELVRADALLGAAEQVDCLKHLVERDARVLENRADLDRELFFAITALVEAVADALRRVRLDLADAINAPAMRADWAVRPQPAF